jgi:hypothetical protein
VIFFSKLTCRIARLGIRGTDTGGGCGDLATAFRVFDFDRVAPTEFSFTHG